MRNRHRGFTLVELLIALSLLGVFALLAYRLLGANFNLTVATRTANDNAARFDDALRRLRADVSDSSAIEMTEANVLRVQDPGQPIIAWRMDHNQLSRKAGNEIQQWNVGHPLTLKLDGAVVLLCADSAEPIAMASIAPSTAPSIAPATAPAPLAKTSIPPHANEGTP